MLYKPVTVNAATTITEVNFTVDFSKIPSVTMGEQVPYETADSGALSIAESEKCSVYCEGWLSKQDGGGWDSVYDSIYNDSLHGSNTITSGHSDNGKFSDQYTFTYYFEIHSNSGYEFNQNDDVNFIGTNASVVWKMYVNYGWIVGITSGGSGSGSSESDGSNGSGCDHSYEWVEEVPATATEDAVYAYKCSKCGHIDAYMNGANSAYMQFNRDAAQKIKKASQNSTVIINTDRWTSFHRTVIDELAKRSDVTLIVTYTDTEHHRKAFTIPAGTQDIPQLIDENGYSGFKYLLGKFGETAYPIKK